jgi:hypothetical protein
LTSTIINTDNLVDKVYSLFEEHREYIFLSEPAKKIIRETALIDIIQSLVDYGNSSVLESFKIRIEMEQDDIINHTPKEEYRV